MPLLLIELALAGNASCIITNNIRDLKNAELTFSDLRIETPEQFLQGEKYGNFNYQDA